MSTFDEIYEQTATFVPTEEWLESQGENWKALAETPIEGDDKSIRTVGQAHMSIEVDYQGIPKNVMAAVFGVDRYMDEYGRHRIKDVNHWEYKVFEEVEWGVPKAWGAYFFNTDPPSDSIPLCPIGLGAG